MNQTHEPNISPASGEVIGLWCWLWGTALIVLAALAFGPLLANGYITEDLDYVVNNPAMRSLQGLADIWLKFDSTDRYYPLTFSTFWIEYQLWGAHPLGYHAVVVLVHAIAAVL